MPGGVVEARGAAGGNRQTVGLADARRENAKTAKPWHAGPMLHASARGPRPRPGAAAPAAAGRALAAQGQPPDSARGGIVEQALRREADTNRDVHEDELPHLGQALSAAAAVSMRAGRFAVADVVRERCHAHGGPGLAGHVRPEHGHGPDARAAGVRHPHEMPGAGRFRSSAAPVYPEAPLSLAWSSCSRTGRLLQGSTVLAIRPVQPGEHGALSASAAATAPALAWEDRPDGVSFSVTLEMCAGAPPGQRPKVLVGATAAPPAEGCEGVRLQAVARDPGAQAEQCYLLGCTGAVFSEGERVGMVEVDWPPPKEDGRFPARSRGRLVELSLLVAKSGALRLSVDGHEAVRSREGLVPWGLALSARDLLLPMLLVESNVARATLRHPRS
ncbi:unnamed protein product [Prorocentrum cordatum]|uniref:Beta-galactosidase n=1 Tax=Prorocentrum cordatum TaxID=2364126 RepID=A0ABN9XAX1_9DINO|nr:unnamed protein product [Polarella glacialis]